MKKAISILLSLIITTSAFALVPAQADCASKKAKAIKAYKKFLVSYRLSEEVGADKPQDLRFSAVYVDKNSVPELVVWNGGNAVLYTYKNNKVRNVSDLHFGFLSEKFKYYKKTGIFTDETNRYGTVTFSYRKLSGAKYTFKLAEDSSIGSAATSKSLGFYKFDSKQNRQKISEKTFKGMLKKLTKGKKMSVAKFHYNTKKNRNKYLK